MTNEKDRERVSNGADSESAYLWDGSGAVDPLVESLERDLAGSALQAKMFDERGSGSRAGLVKGRRLGWLAAAAIVLIGASLWLNFNRGGTSWIVEKMEGSPLIGSLALGSDSRIARGKWITTDATSRATFRNRGGLGSVTLDPNGRLRMLRSSSREQRFELGKGRISAAIYAPPKLFIVDTPSAKAIDMGCAYTLDVDESGDGLLSVSIGRVDLSGSAGDVRVTAGGACRIRPGVGPGTPYFEDASAKFIAAVARFDEADRLNRPAASAEILAMARDRDSITVWHVALRVSGSDRSRAIDRLYEMVPELGPSAPSGPMSDSAILKLWQGLGLAW